MRIGILSDAHGNVGALEVCLDFLKEYGVEKIYHLGDIAGYLPQWREVFELLNDNQVFCLKGNHDAMLLSELSVNEDSDKVYRISEARQMLTPDIIDIMKEWPDFLMETIDDVRVCFIHGSPRDHLQGYVYGNTDVLFSERIEMDILFLGHTHIPFVREIRGVKIVNVGSCGLPRDNGSMLSFAVSDLQKKSVKIFRLEYNSLCESNIQKSGLIHNDVIKCFGRKCESLYGEICQRY